jgi:K(+)-stimulated pyrophosphate-energized sodium pump
MIEQSLLVYGGILITALVGCAVVYILARMITKMPVEHEKAASIAAAIRKGAMVFLKEEYRVISLFVVGIALLFIAIGHYLPAACFVMGCFLSLITGFIGMRTATKANVLTALAAQKNGERSALLMAFFGGSVMGFAVASCGLLGLGFLLYFFSSYPNFELIITAFALGASLVAFFARVGGGIYTKSADVGADLAGKLEAGIPEDDPRNPAVIADNVGDCVGDTAGMGADIYESYIGAMVSTIILATVAYPNDFRYVLLPLAISACGLVGSLGGLVLGIIGRFGPAALLRNALYGATVLFAGLSYWYMSAIGIDMALFVSIILGCVGGIVVGLITEYYTSSWPIRKLAENSTTGAATNIIYGLSIGMESMVLPVISLALCTLAAYTYGGGLFGVSLAAVAMLATVGMTMTIDAYGPIADNAGGIAEMADLGKSVRAITDKLDALGNTTAAMGKGFAIGSALFAALGIFVAYTQKAGFATLSLTDPHVLVGLFFGSTLPFLISALTMRSVGQAALKMVMEVRRQFKEIPGLMEGTAAPDYERCIAISTQASLRQMILPGVLTVGIPVIVKFVFGTLALGGFLVGATVVGVALALMMANGGGAWDNAKKYIEAGHLGGKGSDAHKAAVVGDTVGDPFKDTSGPALNILIKLMSMLALVLVLL